MRLALSSAAAPDASLEELLDACVRRGIDALELEEGHGHGLDPGTTHHEAAADAAARARAFGVALAGFRLAMPLPDPDDAPALAAFGGALGAPLLVPLHGPAAERSGAGREGAELVRALDRAGARAVAVVVGGGVEDVTDPAAPLAWDADPTRAPLSAAAARLLEGLGPRLVHVRLLGGGPEASQQEGRGVGALMARLALAGFGGTIALAPSSARYRVIWDAWLGRRGGWGCGSQVQDPSLVSLTPSHGAIVS